MMILSPILRPSVAMVMISSTAGECVLDDSLVELSVCRVDVVEMVEGAGDLSTVAREIKGSEKKIT